MRAAHERRGKADQPASQDGGELREPGGVDLEGLVVRLKAERADQDPVDLARDASGEAVLAAFLHGGEHGVRSG